jgi:hypothetical protein
MVELNECGAGSVKTEPIVIGFLAGGVSAQQPSPEGANLFALSSLTGKKIAIPSQAIEPALLTAHLARNGIGKLRNDPCSAPSSKVYRVLSIYMLGEIPDRSLRRAIAAMTALILGGR